MTRKLLLGASAFILGLGLVAHAQSPNNLTVQGAATNRSSVLAPAVITTGLTYQLLLPGIAPTNPASAVQRGALIIQNNTVSAGAFSTDLCYVLIATPAIASQIVAGTTTTSTNITANVNGVSKTLTAAQWSSVYSGGGSYNRLWPYTPSDPVYGTCATASDSIYVETQ